MLKLYPESLNAVRLTLIATLSLLASPALAIPAPAYDSLIDQINLAKSPTSLESQANYEAAEGRALQARVLPNPSVTIGSASAYGSGSYAGYQRANTRVFITQPLEIWGQRSARIAATSAQADVAQRRTQQALLIAGNRIAQAYVDAEAAERRFTLATEALALARTDEQTTQILARRGRESALRTVLANSDVVSAESWVAKSQADRDAAFIQLAVLTLLDQPVNKISTSLLDRVPNAATVPTQKTGSIGLAKAELETAALLVAQEKSRAYPATSVSFGATRYSATSEHALSLAVNFSVPLFNRNTGNIAAVQAEQRATIAKWDAIRQNVATVRQSAQASLNLSGSRIQAANTGASVAEEAYRLSRAGFTSGRISQQELRNIRTTLIDARNRVIDSLQDRANAEINLARMEGRIPFREAQ